MSLCTVRLKLSRLSNLCAVGTHHLKPSFLFCLNSSADFSENPRRILVVGGRLVGILYTISINPMYSCDNKSVDSVNVLKSSF